MIKIGLTGGIACGKTTVAEYLKKLGAAIVDADAIAHQLSKIGGPIYCALAEHFGDEIALNEDKTLNRAKIAAVVFHDDKERRWINSATHPIIIAAIKAEIEKCAETGYKVAFVDAPLLFETGLDKICDIVWVVAVNQEMQLKRLQDRDKMALELAQDRIKSQMPVEEKCRRADLVIDNSRSIADMQKFVKTAWDSVTGGCLKNYAIVC